MVYFDIFKIFRLSLIVLGSLFILLGALASEGAQFRQPSQKKEGSFEAKQTIEHEIKTNWFGVGTVDRYLDDYVMLLGEAFLFDLADLHEEDHWLDGGSGNSRAIESYFSGQLNRTSLVSLLNQDFFQPESRRRALLRIIGKQAVQRAHVTGVTYKGRIPGDYGDRLRVLRGHFFESIPVPVLIAAPFGKVRLITDVYGVLAYTMSPDVALEHYLSLLTKDGAVYIHNALMNTTVICRVDGTPVDLKNWLVSLPGLHVTVLEASGSLKIQKIEGAKVTIPKLALQHAYDFYHPQGRVFDEVGNPPAGIDTERWNQKRAECRESLGNQIREIRKAVDKALPPRF